jgi:hypothetical protein
VTAAASECLFPASHFPATAGGPEGLTGDLEHTGQIARDKEVRVPDGPARAKIRNVKNGFNPAPNNAVAQRSAV